MGLKKIEQVCTNSGGLVYVPQKIEQACSILKEVYICCSKIVDPVSLSKGRCAQSVSIKNRYFVICFYCCETDRMIFGGNIICLTFS